MNIAVLFRININKLKGRNKHILVAFSIFMVNYFTAHSQESQLQGKFIDNLGTTIPFASISLYPDNILIVADKNGKFAYKKLYAGTYQYEVKMQGYQMDAGELTLLNGINTKDFKLAKTNNAIDEVLVSGIYRRNPTLIQSKNAAMPVTVIDRETIQSLGSRRLDEVLREQTGMAIVNNTAGGSRSVGIQLQGLSSQYIMVLMDGQPLMGRQSGNLDLSRISVSNIERIEIIKGASSCLYGSDALGGAINIITRMGTNTPQLYLQTSYGTNNTLDVSLDAESNFNKNKGYITLSTNYYKTDGFNTNTYYVTDGTTVPPYNNRTIQGKIRHQIGNQNNIAGISVYNNNRNSLMTRNYATDHSIEDEQKENQFNIIATLDQRWSANWKALSSYYFSQYSSKLNINNSGLSTTLTDDEFTQELQKIEQQVAFQNEKYQVTFGLLGQLEQMNDQSNTAIPSQYSIGLYSQGNYALSEKTRLIAGLRYDQTKNYGFRFSPSIGVEQDIISNLTLKIGVSSGFKAPDFRTRYQIFYNPAANYYVIGSEVLQETITKMDQAGTISEIRTHVLKQLENPLKAENNTSYTIGLNYHYTKNMRIEVNAFMHRLKNQINSIQVATGERNMAIYSFQNLPRSVSKGFEVSFVSNILENVRLQAGYQYLIAKDLSIADSIAANVWPYNQNIHDPITGNSYAPTTKSYWGLENRSRHQFNASLTYHYTPWDIEWNVRAIFRGKYPFGDTNGNYFIDKYDVFVHDHILYHSRIQKKWNNLTAYLAVENLTNYVNYLIPGQTGRLWNVGLSYTLKKS